MILRTGAAVAAILAVSGAFGSAMATSDHERCITPAGAKWMSIEQVAAKARELGYENLREIEKDDGCWEFKTRSSDGSRIEVYLHPVTGEVVKTERD